jgi:hypothetical protein
MDFAAEKLEEAVASFARLEEKFRASKIREVPRAQIQAVMTDLDAAIPGLSGAERGRALLLKAMCFEYRFLHRLSQSPLYDPSSPDSQLPRNAMDCAVQGRALLEKHAKEDVPWADSVIAHLSGYGQAQVVAEPPKRKLAPGRRRKSRRAK